MAIMVIKVTITFLSNSSDDDDSRFIQYLKQFLYGSVKLEIFSILADLGSMKWNNNADATHLLSIFTLAEAMPVVTESLKPSSASFFSDTPRGATCISRWISSA